MKIRGVMLMLIATSYIMLMTAHADGRNKKVIIHVPYKVRNVKHTHTIFKTVHHHHAHHEPYGDHSYAPSEEHEHFHHMHIHEEMPDGQHNRPVPEIDIPEFLPELAMNTVGLRFPDMPLKTIPRPRRDRYPYKQKVIDYHYPTLPDRIPKFRQKKNEVEFYLTLDGDQGNNE